MDDVHRPIQARMRLWRTVLHGSAGGRALSTCAAAVEAIRAARAGHPDGYAKAATPVTSARHPSRR
jgi:hypothetical protein